MHAIVYIFAYISLLQLSVAIEAPDKELQLESVYYYPTQKDGSTVTNSLPVIAEIIPLNSSSDSIYDIEEFQDVLEAQSSIQSVEDSIYSNFEVVSDFESDLEYDFLEEQF